MKLFFTLFIISLTTFPSLSQNPYISYLGKDYLLKKHPSKWDWEGKIYSYWKYYPGEIITIKGDTISGYVQHKNRLGMQYSCTFYKDTLDKTSGKEYFPSELKAYSVGDKIYHTLNVGDVEYLTNTAIYSSGICFSPELTKLNIENEKSVYNENNGWKRFVLLLDENIISTYVLYLLYYYYTADEILKKNFEINYNKNWNLYYKSEYEMDLDLMIPTLCHVKEGLNPITTASLLINCNKKLYPFIKDCPGLLTKLLDNKIYFDNTPEIIEEYNQCKRNN